MLRGLLLSAALAAGVAAETRPLALDDMYALKDVDDPHLSPDVKWVAYTVATTLKKKDDTDIDVWMTPVAGGEPVQLTTSPESESSPRFSPDGKYLAFLAERDDEGSQVWLMNRLGGEATKLTDYTADVSSFVWSPDGTRLAVIVSDPDPSEAEDEDDEVDTAKPIVIHRLKFKSDGEGYLSDVREHIHVFELTTKASFQLTSGPYDDSAPAWSPDGKTLAFASNRSSEPDLNSNTDIFVVEVKEGASPRALTTSGGQDTEPAFSPDGKWIAFVEEGASVEDAIYTSNRLALVPVAGGASKPLTPSLDRNVSAPRFTPDGRAVLFVVEDGGNHHLARVAVTGGAIERPVAGERTVFSFDQGPKGELVVLEGQPEYPAEVSAVTPQGLKRLTRVNDAFLEGIRLGRTQHLKAKAPDGASVDLFLVTPPDYLQGTKLPLLLLPHGGPQSQDSTEWDFPAQFYAASGYAVVMPNYRGSTGYGAAWGRAIWADWGNKDLMDTLAAVDQVISMGVADPERLGMGGWSYGGYLTNYAITKTSRFKAAVSGASGAIMLANYGTDDLLWWWEGELGLPWKNVALWQRLSPYLDVEKVKTPTLILCGALDMRVPLLNSEQLYLALRRLGVETELVIYPDEYHELETPSYIRDRRERSLAWYDKYLKPAR